MSGGGKGGGDQVVGYKYFFGIHMGISRGPVDSLNAIHVGDRPAWWGEHTTNWGFFVDAENLFGGEKAEGGIKGWVEPMFGYETQDACWGLKAMRGNNIPGYRRTFTIFFNGLISMINPYPKAWKFRVRRVLSGWDGEVWYPEKAVVMMTAEDAPKTEYQKAWDGYYASYARYEQAMVVWNILRTGGSVTQRQGLYYLFVRKSAGSGFREPVPPPVPTIVDDGLSPYGPVSIKAMNGAHIVYECLTNREWGRGLARDRIDDDTFRAAADKLFAEGFGLCIKWSRRDTITSFIKSILNHIGGVLTQDRANGKIRLTLIRGDYVKDDLPLFTHDTGLVDVTENVIAHNSAAINEVKVKYRHPIYDKTRMVRTENLAAIRASGGVIRSSTTEYPGIPNASMAMKIAQRDLQASSVSLRKFAFILDRRGRKVYPGDVIRIQDPSRNIADTVVRIATVGEGFLTSGKIQATGVQDVFTMPTTTFTVPQENLATPESKIPCVADHRAFELPYFMVMRNTSAADLDYIDSNSAFVGVVCDKGRAVNGNYDIAVKRAAPTDDEFITDFDYICEI